MVVKYQEDKTSGFTVFVGRVVHSKSLKQLEILPRAALGVRSDGTIAFLRQVGHSPEALRESYAEDGFASAHTVHLKRSQFLFPGMIDTHLHAPQWPNLALGMEGDLRKWVEDWTDPIEVYYLS